MNLLPLDIGVLGGGPAAAETPRLEGLLPEGFDGLYIPRRVEDGDWSSIRRARSARRAEVYDR